ncbi:unnamed protein product [Eruca vesicaria subsp. sativa]|uniref:F-box domain-containing protein n=1 Tax=Eruca vesicaria subsp. sativa TaxID=29727 RepID=A0ABC8IXL5_ERUVS|nr:unnamed protein product [Eruca vesicaria subsp. sativa]
MKKQATSGSWLPNDLISEILLRLPAKSVGRFRCVSKLWLSITTDPCFIKSFGTIQRPSLLLCSIKGQNMFVTTHQRSYTSFSQPIPRYHMKALGQHCYFSNMDSVHGLICIEDVCSRKPLVWNPTTGQLLVLPKPKMSSRHINAFLGYDSVGGKHKVMCLPYKKTCYVCRVFTLGSGQESWRTVRTNLKHWCRGFASGQCINGVIYYLAYNISNKPWYLCTVIMSFDVRSEIFHTIELPSDFHDDVLITYEGRLACIDEDNDKRLWSLEDVDNKQKWSFQDFRKPLHKLFELQGFTQAGEFVYVPYRFQKSSFIKFYDPVSNIRRRLKLEGIENEEFGNSVKGFTNHIESLMPL